MEIRVFGMTLRLEVIIITLLLGMIMGGHLLCSCAKVPISEAFSAITEGEENMKPVEQPTNSDNAIASGGGGGGGVAPANQHRNASPENVGSGSGMGMGMGMGLGALGAGLALGGTTPTPEPATEPVKQQTATNTHADSNEAFSDYAAYRGGENNTDITGSWISKASKYSNDLGYQATAGKSNTYVGTAVPLPDGELFFFKNNQFKPECCPGPYSSSTGCACMSAEQVKYLNTRGGNRTSDSEF
jgi:hypothetical protein